MNKKIGWWISQNLFKNRFLFLLILLLLFILFAPVFEAFTGLRIFLDIFVSLIFLFVIYTKINRKYLVIIASLLVFPMLVSLWLPYFSKGTQTIIIGGIGGILFFAFTIFNILNFIYSEKEVSRDLIAGAVVVYLLIAIMWAIIYMLIERLHPGSFIISQNQIHSDRLAFIYYSFGTITSLGIGDIAPASGLADSFTIVEAVVGQFYLVVMVAWLVGMYVAKKSK